MKSCPYLLKNLIRLIRDTTFQIYKHIYNIQFVGGQTNVGFRAFLIAESAKFPEDSGLALGLDNSRVLNFVQ